MKTIDKEFLKKFIYTVDKYNRTIKTPGIRSEKQKFVSRLGMFLKNRCFKLRFHIKTGDGYNYNEVNKTYVDYAIFVPYVTTDFFTEEEKNRHAGFTFANTWSNHEFKLTYVNHRGEEVEKILHYNQLLRLEYEEITANEFSNILKLFK